MEPNIIPFNPLDRRHLGESVGQAMLRQPVVPLSELRSFPGAGIYAIYYVGDFAAYEAIAQCNRDGRFSAPIYVGKAVPKGSRTGISLKEVNPGTVLFSRLSQHKHSIEAVTNLDISHFHCRYLTVDDIWIPLGESLLIGAFVPLWNTLLDGFGNHDPGSGRHAGRLSRWDTLHPGRAWCKNCRSGSDTPEQLIGEVRAYLRDNPPSGNSSLFSSV